ncbi:Wzz/FepE/Etk N-terminal domain-containing protein [Bacillus sp. REN10]|uniref:YveK family protein n=1 Tax=Bacillus sp. REN10 TaxID=2782541 RepID=UPI00193C8369|nr:Wzz/FepE/Etk N-terminal domain-containing protein [Bacillus sp. REN10]
MEETISLRELTSIVWKRMKLIVSITFLFALLSGIISYFVLTPVYETSTQLLVNQAKSGQQLYEQADVQTNLQLINTYNVIIKSPAILDKVKANLQLDVTYDELNNQITVQNETDSQVVNIAVQDTDPKRAAMIANEVATVFQKEIVKIMNVNNVSILAKAEGSKDMAPVKPQPLLNIAIAFVVGLMVSIGLAFLLEYLDQTIKSEQDVEQALDLPTIGVVSVIGTSEQGIRKSRSKNKAVRGESVGF